MKRIALLLLMAGTLLGCRKDRNTDCNNFCPYISIGPVIIKFVDNKGLAADVKGYSVVNQRTGEQIHAHYTSSKYVKGTFVVVDGSYIGKLSEAGDDLKVTGTSVETNQTKTAIVKVTGGKCACNIEKVSGPSQIAFD